MRNLTVVSLVLLAAATLGACKGETKIQDTKATLDDLDSCRKQMAEKDKLIKDYESTIARNEAQGQKSGEIVVTIEGTALTVTPAKAGVTRPIADKDAAAATQAFLDLVAKSHGAIQKCYVNALKNNAGLQAHSVKLTVSASFGAAGAFKDSSFNAPVELGDAFRSCMRTVAAKWVMPATTPAMTVQAPVSLTPS